MISKHIMLWLSLGLIVLTTACNAPQKEQISETATRSDYYTEKHRPQYHFSPDHGWMNDPNGMVYHDGEYHIFYQYYPNGITWDSMHWGHAVSPDMLKWEHLPIALYPDDLGYIFSGSAVIDHNNTSGLGKDGQGPMIAVFTHHNMDGEKAKRLDFQYQSIAYSNDNGRSWTKYEGNPVVKNPGIKDFRDPKVIWDEDNDQWVMVFAAYDKVRFYTSPNLIDWVHTGEFGIEGDTRLWECPDIFELQVEGTDMTQWVLIVSIQKEAPNGGTATGYFLGDWNGKTFVGDASKLKWLDYGTDNYALVTWANIPKSDGRRLALGWMSNWQYAQKVPTERWRSAMTLPRELKLIKTDNNEYSVVSRPVKELSKYESITTPMSAKTYNAPTEIYNDKNNTNVKVDLSFEMPKKGIIHLRLSNDHDEHLDLGYNVSEQSYFIDRTFAGPSGFSDVFADYHTAPAEYNKSQVDMSFYLDQASVELFSDGGKTVMTDIFFPTAPFHKIEIIAETNDILLKKGNITTIKSTWR